MRLGNKGMTLLESLFAFLIYLQVIIMLLTLFSSSMKANKTIESYIDKEVNKEVYISNIDSIEDIIEMVLH